MRNKPIYTPDIWNDNYEQESDKMEKEQEKQLKKWKKSSYEEVFKDKITNIDYKSFHRMKKYEDRHYSGLDHSVFGDDYIFYLDGSFGYKIELPKMNLLIISGHEPNDKDTILIYNTKTKIFEKITFN